MVTKVEIFSIKAAKFLHQRVPFGVSLAQKLWSFFFCKVLSKSWSRNFCWDKSRWLKVPSGNHFIVANRTLWVESWNVWMKLVDELCSLSDEDPWLGAN